MGKKKKESLGVFDFEKYAEILLEEAESKGLLENVIFKTQFREFCRMSMLCDRMFAQLQEEELTEVAHGRQGSETFKTNPLIKDYTTSHKALITTANSLFKLVDSVKVVEKEDAYFM